ncbi:ABC transporter ATP-binding protein [Streptomyces sp. AK08-02]|uniref:ABC transporter ATP-binding protein n=1 Tax=Streptomyces sp. AK08-02 TaxID=3028654 RepID=UPI0029A0840D|nr:ABC transporter ATP-binding protein [Streptomyces sp. AK08-02]MDX3753223.1 ABC transporter ATP-binding protein [Streptomyces sp. AK08-02]
MASDADDTRNLRGPALRRLAGICLRHPGALVPTLVGAVGATATSVAVPLLTQIVLDDVVVSAVRPLLPWIGLLLLAALARYALTFLRRHYANRLAADVQHELRTAMFRAVSRPDGPGPEGLGPGQLMGRATGDLDVVHSLVATLPALLSQLTTVVGVLAVMAMLSVPLTLVSLAMLPMLWLLASRSHPRMLAASWRAQDRAAAVAGVVQSSVAGVQLVKGHGREQQETARFTEAARELYTARLRLNRLVARYQPALQAVPALTQVAVLFLGGWLATRGDLSLGTFVALSMYLTQLADPMRQLAGLLSSVQQGTAACERVLEVTGAPPSHPDGMLPLPGDGPLAVEFDRVAFGHDPGRRVLDGLILRIEPGETVAVVGGTGTGKSTLALLLARFHEAQSGSVRIGGTDVRDLCLDALRGALALVPEETFLFAGTVRENIALGRPDATDAEIREAARLAWADDFVTALPGGYDTELTERGQSLSGGQRQRLALARALLARPRLLVLDDATSAVDTRVEAAIHAGLRTLAHDHSTLLIARRPSTLALADRIAVLDDGRITDIGTEPELLTRCPQFRALFGHEENPTRQPHPETTPADTPAPAARPLSAALTTAVPTTSTPQTPPTPDNPAVDEASATRPLTTPFSLRTLTRGFRLPLVAGLALVLAEVGCGLAQPYAVRWGIESTVGSVATGALTAACVAALAVALLRWAVQGGSIRVTGRTGERLLYSLRLRMTAHLHRLGLDHYEREADGRILTRMTTDVDAVAGFLQTGLLAFLASLLTMAGVLVALLVTDPVLLLVVLVALPALYLATAVLRGRAVAAYQLAREHTATVNAALQESAEGMRVIQAFRAQDAFLRRFAAHSDAYRRARIRSQFLMAVYFPFIECVAAVAAAGVLALGAQRVRDGAMEVGTLVAYLLYLELFFVPVQQLSQLYDAFQQARVSLDRIGALLNLPTSTPLPEHPHPVVPLHGEITFRDVRFRYADDTVPALAGVTLTIPAGQRVAVVGETGSGKSTLLKLVPRFYDPTAGTVLIDGTDVTRLDLSAYRQRLGVIPQEPYLFAGPVRDAIAYGRPDATDAEIEAAARATGAHAFVTALPGGYRHQLTEGGRNLSVGQRQLIALTRTQLAAPAILLLDEATSALDPATEALVNTATDRLATRRTALIVTHRLALAARADRVLVLADGRVREDGRHDELLALGGHYAALWRAHEAHPRTALQTQGRPL